MEGRRWRAGLVAAMPDAAREFRSAADRWLAPARRPPAACARRPAGGLAMPAAERPWAWRSTPADAALPSDDILRPHAAGPWHAATESILPARFHSPARAD